ncbi:hypothetical protein [Ilumatobacter coccineus]|nr:hypothetical protein [Ilumatobacter coccineus]
MSRIGTILFDGGLHEEALQAQRDGHAVRALLPDIERASREWRDQYF